ncbi:recombinase family protein [Hymenobacter arizonensis]|uniref:Site-specific DNA recombinase n=1 Tax=Hymenobacter arizonensis TaxID=1227077 RepID=A0A1I5Z826_HYMAR|nr:recombinase family protein [Hymenobacter arizonensis]SFQ52610.1 Site-specific DNA recombinase [Hymenobacter arizonensis]
MTTPNNQYVAYYRVSTDKQGRSGLGLEAQRAAVHAFVPQTAELLAQFTEVESGRNNKRPQLQAALDMASQTGAILLVAKLDRLARNVAFLAELMESRVRFKAVDVPEADEFTIHILAAVAQREAVAISQRTCAALAAKKARGFQLGTPSNLTDKARMRSIEVRQEKARQQLSSRQARRLCELLRAQGASLQAIVRELNASGYRTPNGKLFYKSAIARLLVSTGAIQDQNVSVAFKP